MPQEWDLPIDVENLIFDAIDITEVYVPESYYVEKPPHTIFRAPQVATTLVVCSCVCKVWRKYALERLFKIVKLDPRHTVSALSTFKSRWNVDFKIQTLNIDWQAKLTRESFAEIDVHLKGLQSLIVRRSFQLAFLDGLVPNLRFLHLSILEGLPQQELQRMLVGLPRLKALHLQIRHIGSIFKRKEDMMQQIRPQSIKLEELSIFQGSYQELDCWLWLLQSSEQTLHTVSIHGDLHVEKDIIKGFLRAGKSIRRLNIYHWEIQLIIPALLPLCPNLTHATFSLGWFLGHYRSILSLFPSNLTSIRLCNHSNSMYERLNEGKYQSLADIILQAVAASHLTQLRELLLDVFYNGLDTLVFGTRLKERVGECLKYEAGIECRVVIFDGKDTLLL